MNKYILSHRERNVAVSHVQRPTTLTTGFPAVSAPAYPCIRNAINYDVQVQRKSILLDCAESVCSQTVLIIFQKKKQITVAKVRTCRSKKSAGPHVLLFCS